jgi:hypothetical protein
MAIARTTDMKIALTPFLLPTIILCAVASATAGDSGYSQHTSVVARIHSKWDNQPRAIRILGAPFVFFARAGETFLHAPQIPSEALEGDRLLVSKRGVLAQRDVPVEDCILSPAD